MKLIQAVIQSSLIISPLWEDLKIANDAVTCSASQISL